MHSRSSRFMYTGFGFDCGSACVACKRLCSLCLHACFACACLCNDCESLCDRCRASDIICRSLCHLCGNVCFCSIPACLVCEPCCRPSMDPCKSAGVHAWQENAFVRSAGADGQLVFVLPVAEDEKACKRQQEKCPQVGQQQQQVEEVAPAGRDRIGQPLAER